jgi:hypothetical protein
MPSISATSCCLRFCDFRHCKSLLGSIAIPGPKNPNFSLDKSYFHSYISSVPLEGSDGRVAKPIKYKQKTMGSQEKVGKSAQGKEKGKIRNPKSEGSDMVQFADFTEEERVAVKKILDRTQKVIVGVDRLALEMDLAAVHASNPLRLEELSEADDANFFHDIGEISENLNRETGKLQNCFVPRYSMSHHERAERARAVGTAV